MVGLLMTRDVVVCRCPSAFGLSAALLAACLPLDTQGATSRPRRPPTPSGALVPLAGWAWLSPAFTVKVAPYMFWIMALRHSDVRVR